MSGAREEGVRPGLWLFTAFFVAVAGVFVYALTVPNGDPLGLVTSDAERAAAERTARAAPRRQRQESEFRRGPTGQGGSYAHHDWSHESEAARDLALGLPSESFWRDRETYGPPQRDPQLAAMWRSFQHARPPEGDAPPLPFEPTARRAELVDSDGEVAANPSSCDVRVLPVSASGFNCVVRVQCDGQVLYPNANQTAGYVPCELDDEGRVVRAVDDGSTGSDGDPLVNLDLASGTVTVEDFMPDGSRRYRATLRI